jgi:arsenical pump membrane protein
VGAALLVVTGLLSISAAAAGVGKGTDVYLFLTGMMLLAELARNEGVFDWLAGLAVRTARGSRTRLFTLVYLVGTLVTVFLSNDATAVVLTPAVYAAVKRARVSALPYLFVCAFIANAASFVLPISNPANLVVYGRISPPYYRGYGYSCCRPYSRLGQPMLCCATFRVAIWKELWIRQKRRS